MVSKELSEAAVEFNCILKYTSQEIVTKIPNNFINFMNSIASKTYEFNYDKTKSLNEQDLKNETRGLISLVYQDYICNEKEKSDYLNKCYKFNENKEKIAREKYNSDNLFKPKIATDTIEHTISENTAIVEYKSQNFIKKLLNKLKDFFGINN